LCSSLFSQELRQCHLIESKIYCHN
jgi:hypothetical protein